MSRFQSQRVRRLEDARGPDRGDQGEDRRARWPWGPGRPPARPRRRPAAGAGTRGPDPVPAPGGRSAATARSARATARRSAGPGTAEWMPPPRPPRAWPRRHAGGRSSTSSPDGDQPGSAGLPQEPDEDHGRNERQDVDARPARRRCRRGGRARARRCRSAASTPSTRRGTARPTRRRTRAARTGPRPQERDDERHGRIEVALVDAGREVEERDGDRERDEAHRKGIVAAPHDQERQRRWPRRTGRLPSHWALRPMPPIATSGAVSFTTWPSVRPLPPAR